MSFRLKNVDAMYQRAMITLFYDMMQREVKVYVDDIFVKSKKKKIICKYWGDCLRGYKNTN